MFCKNCGTDNLDTARFCVGCGTDLTAAPAEPVYEEPAVQEPVYQEPVYQAPEAPAEENAFSQAFDKAADFGKNYVEEAKKDKKKLLIPIIAVAATLTLILVIALCSSPWKKPLNNYEKIMNGNISESRIEKLYPEEFWEENDVDPDEIAEMLEESYEEGLEYYEDEYGDNVKFSMKVTEKDKLSDKKLDDLKDELHEQWGIKKKSVKKAYELEVEMTIKGSDDKDTEDMEITVVKIGSKWYIADGMSF